ncbi:MAG: N,N-dimethylformamidase beta subunit family domain-containing protein [Anaerolineae bacterium]
MSNKIIEENKLPGNSPTEWDINGWGDPSIQGFGHDISIDLGETIYFKIKTDSIDYRIDIYRMGYYNEMGARKVGTVLPTAELPQTQPEGLRDPITKLYDCGNWAISAEWTCPADAVSGIYFARLVRHDPSSTNWRSQVVKTPDTVEPEAREHAYGASGHGKPSNALKEPWASHIYFIVRDDAAHSEIIFQTSDTTWQAYNRYGGHSTYAELDPNYPRIHGKPNRAHKVSYNRPMETRHYRAVNKVFNGEYPFVRWLERNGFDVSYSTGVDSARRGEVIQNHKLFLSVGHDEYWSGGQRTHVEAARAAGVNLAFFSGNEVFWKTRWEPSIDGTETDYRTMVTYKETQDNAKIDPEPDVWTGTWRDGREFNPEGAQPENALTGTIFTVNAWRNDPLIVPAEYGHLRLWRNTKVADLKPGERAVLLKGLLGHEWDEDIDNGHRPPGLFHLSETTVDNVWYVQDEGGVFDSGTATHHLTLYRHESGALVFGAGTVQWGWGLDAHHDTDTGVPPEKANPSSTRIGFDPHGPDITIQQATVNLFADMGVQPQNLQDDLVRGDQSADSEAPVSSIDFPADGAKLPLGMIQIQGRAQDFGGGVVGGVEISLNGGERWHPVVGRETWHFDWTPTQAGEVKLCCRAVDDSGNLEEVKQSNQCNLTILS